MTLIWNIIQSVITILEIRVCVWMMEKFAEPRYSGKKTEDCGVDCYAGELGWRMHIIDGQRHIIQERLY